MRLKRVINRWDLVALAINSTIGAGIFGLPAKVAALIGTSSLIAFVICAFVVSLIVLCFAEVSSRFSATGGPYLYAREAFGAIIGFEVGWLFWIVRVTGFATNTNLFINYLGYFFPDVTSTFVRIGIILLVVSIFTLVNFRGIKESVWMINIFTVGKLLSLFIFIIVGLFYVDSTLLTSTQTPQASDLSKAVLMLIYAFTGFEMVTIPAREMEKPQTDLPFSLLVATGVVATFYILIQLVCLGTLPNLAASEKPLADSALIFLGVSGATFITIGALVSTFGSLNSSVLSAPRLLFAMAENRELPQFLAKTHRRFQTPHISIFLTATVMLIFTIQTSFITALTISTIVRLIVYAVTCLSLPVFRARKSASEASFLAPLGIFVSIASLILIIFLLVNVNYKNEGFALIICIIFGLIIYFLNRFFNKTDLTAEESGLE
jgi:APA family basic amino acid/polyamine antiporter